MNVPGLTIISGLIFLESDLDDIEQMLIDNHVDDGAISGILDKLIHPKRGLRAVLYFSWSRSLAHLLPNIFTQIFEQKNYRILLPRVLTLSIKLRRRIWNCFLENPKPLSS